MTAELCKRGFSLNHKTVQRLISSSALFAV
ncbi:transposase [Aminipila butyrica]|uniref:Transposase n=1 Tax=Aminipila butyrica TaxID=433296 RepID=A0A858C250_9FIRM|nr:transposase [Aminipila butyrica]